MTLVIVGLGAILSASSVIGLRQTGDHLHYFKLQALYVGIGLAGLAAATRIPYRWYRRMALPIFATAIALLVAVLFIGVRAGGSRSWIDVGPASFQPAEFAKLATVIVLATAISRKEDWLEDPVHFFWPVAGSIGLVSGLVLLQPDLGTALIIASGGFAVLVGSRAPLRYITLGGLAGIGAGLLFTIRSPERWSRMTTFLDPMADRLGEGMQGTQSLVALQTGGWFGVGLGASRARWSFLPNAHNDFIFAIIGEETGLAGALVVVALFVTFAVVGTGVALRAPDRFGRLLAIGIVGWISFQAIVNVGGVVSVLPITGVPLPFVSAGGSAMIVSLVAVGILVNIARAGSRP
jgi:cell division protein FtsW